MAELDARTDLDNPAIDGYGIEDSRDRGLGHTPARFREGFVHEDMII